MLMALDMARQFDRVRWFLDAGIDPDPWQAEAIRSTSKRQLWNCCRQAGKSTTAALLALAQAQEPSLTLLISPSQRQSAELLRKVVELRQRIPGLPEPTVETAHKLEFQGGGRIISLPSSESTIRGYSRVALLILDEASRIPDELLSAARPMLATSKGTLIELSTPNGKAGHFFEAWQHGGDTWERFRITAAEVSRIDPAFLEEERATLGDLAYRQEYLCEFLDVEEHLFSSAIIDACFVTESEARPLWQ